MHAAPSGIRRNNSFSFKSRESIGSRIILQNEYPVLRASGGPLNGAAHGPLAPGHPADVLRSLFETGHAVGFQIIPFLRRMSSMVAMRTPSTHSQASSCAERRCAMVLRFGEPGRLTTSILYIPRKYGPEHGKSTNRKGNEEDTPCSFRPEIHDCLITSMIRKTYG